MDFLEKAERLRDKAGISYEEAKAILTETDGDLLEAMIRLEKEGRIAPPPPAADSSTHTSAQPHESAGEERDGHMGRRGFWRYVEILFKKGNRNNLRIKRNDDVVAAIPVTVFVAAIVFAFWVTVPLLIIGLFCGCSYSFAGPDLEKESINKAWDKASQMAESIKEDIKKEMEQDK